VAQGQVTKAISLAPLSTICKVGVECILAGHRHHHFFIFFIVIVFVIIFIIVIIIFIIVEECPA